MGNFSIQLPVAKESEKKTEAYLRDRCKRLQGIAYKFNSPQRRSVPDRHCVMPFKICFYVEVKSQGLKPTDAQWREIHRLLRLGQTVYVADCKADVDYIMGRYQQGMIEYDGDIMRAEL